MMDKRETFRKLYREFLVYLPVGDIMRIEDDEKTRYLADVVKEFTATGRTKSELARLQKISRPTLDNRIKKYNKMDIK